jgi:ribosomal protein L24
MAPKDIMLGSPVKVIKGNNSGRFGRVTKLTPQQLYVESYEDGDIFRVYRTSVEVLHDNHLNVAYPTSADKEGKLVLLRLYILNYD